MRTSNTQTKYEVCYTQSRHIDVATYKLHETHLMYITIVYSPCWTYVFFIMGYCNLPLHEYFYASHEFKLLAKHVISDQGSDTVLKQ